MKRASRDGWSVVTKSTRRSGKSPVAAGDGRARACQHGPPYGEANRQSSRPLD
eukprot:CAMPEP_0204592560 /NCGR_PEP_ID=MMETSP0661-20131031/51011_1 /ASSEMBLY_ACC=CAM_ASM_000606 /TAXON_ID=109239 /ORGANISM="Alexandrium margalefi, Strain AMGDE01CS-322" /LENGTH=52 /DNA_ID=CAMNT_0051602797 /DNA_START=175 /DNA_END=330 /DNA_ORIENTATION=-